MPEPDIVIKSLEPLLVASLTTVIQSRDELPALFERLRQSCGAAIAGPPMAIIHGGAVAQGFLIEAAYPLSHPVEAPGIECTRLEGANSLTMLHYGEHASIRATVTKIYAYLDEHARTTSLFRREIYHTWHPDDPQKNVSEIQVIIHEWDRLLAEGAQRVLGAAACRKMMTGSEDFTLQTSAEDYRHWIRQAIDRLDTLTTDEQQKYQVVSGCAHVFPQERIIHLREIYQSTGDLDAVLTEMYTDHFWYEKPVRKGNVIYMTKNPFDPEGYSAENATPAERRIAYCHCPFVHPYLEEVPSQLSPTFCYCGAGWYRRLWEGILGQPVHIQHVETLLKGNDQCSLAITLPVSLTGEMHPEVE